ncbi:TPA: U2 small nuclear RNA auxiliary factor 2, variant 2 [Trebouxia sp. C0004]
MFSGYDPYAGYYNPDGTPYTYDPNAYTAHDASAAPVEASAAVAANAETAAAAADPSGAASTPVVTPAGTAEALTDASLLVAPTTAEQIADTTGLSGEHAANLLSVDEKASLEQQQEAAEVAQREAEQRFQKAEEQRRNAKVKADEQAAVAAAAQAQAQAEAQAELHRQLQQRLADAQAASLAQEAEKEKRRAQPVTLKGARLAFTAPKAPGKAAATEQTGEPGSNALLGARKPDVTIKLEPRPQPPSAAVANKGAVKPEPPAPGPVKKPGQLFLPQPSTVKNAYLLMAQNKKAADKSAPARQASPPRGPSPRRRPTPPRSPPRRLPSPDSEDEQSRQRSLQEASKKVKGRGNRRYRPEDGGLAEAEAAMGTINGMDRQERDEHRSKHKHHRHHRHRPRDRDGNVIEPSGSGHMSPDRFARPADRAPPSRYVPPPYDQAVDPQSTNGRPGQSLFPGAFSSYNPPPQGEGGHPRHAQLRQQASMQQSQGYDRHHDRYVPTQQQPSDLHGAFHAQPGQGQGQGLPRQLSAQAPAQQRVSGLPMLSDSSEDEDDLPLPGSTSMRAMSVLQKYLSGVDGAAAAAPTTAAATPPAAAAAPMAAPRSAPVAKAALHIPTEPIPGQIQLSSRSVQGRAPPQQAPAPAIATSGYGSDSEHSQLNGNLGSGLGRRGASGGGGAAASDDMDMSPILDKGDSLDAKALAKLPAQLREAAAAAMARHKAELPNQPMERSIDIPGEPAGRPAQHAKRAQRQYRQRGVGEEAEGAVGPVALPNQDAGVAAATRMQEQEYEARARAKRARGEEVQEAEAADDGKRRSKKHKKHHKKEKRERSSRREPESAPAVPLQDRRFVKPPQDDFNRRPEYPPPQQQQQQQGQGPFNRQGNYNQQQGPSQPPGFQLKPSFNQDQAYGGRPDFKQRQQQGYNARDAAPAARRRRQFSDRRTISRSRSPSRSRSRSYSRSRSRSYSRSPSRSRLRSASPRRYNRSVTPPPRRTFGPRPHQHPAAPAPVHGIPPPGSGPAPPQAPPQPYGVLPSVSSFPPSSGAFGHMAPNPLAGMFQPLPAAPPTNPMLVNQQAAAEKAAKAAKRLYVGNLPFETSQAELTSFFDTIMADTGAVAADTEEQGSAVTSCTLYDRSSAAAGPKAKYAFLNLRSVEETSNCVAFDGVYFKTNCLKVRRPDDYDAKKVADLGPSEPSQALNSLVLSQLKRPPPPPPAPILPPAPVLPLGPMPSGEVEDGEVGVAAPVVTRVLKLEHMVARDELLDEEEYSDIVEDITEEIETKYGHITQIAIPRPATPADRVTTGVGFVFVAFEDPAAAVKAQKALHGRMFGENKIDASYYNEAQMQQKIFL